MQDNAIAPTSAPLPIRIAAMIYELLLVTAVIFVAALPFLYLVGNAQTGWVHLVFQIYLVGVLFAYFSAFWLRSGQTLAMKTWRIRLVDRAGGTISFKQAMVRFVVALVAIAIVGMAAVALKSAVDAWKVTPLPFAKNEMWLLILRDPDFSFHLAVAICLVCLAALDFCWPLVDRDRQFLHDRIAGTRLVRVPRKA